MHLEACIDYISTTEIKKKDLYKFTVKTINFLKN